MIRAAKLEKVEPAPLVEQTLDDFEAIFDEMRKNHGSKSLVDGDDESKEVWEVIPYPSPSLGDAVHVGGLALGRVTQFHGIEGSGKTFLAMLMVRETLRRYPRAYVVWADAEQSFDKEWAKTLGIDLRRVKFIETNEAAEIFNQLCGKYNTTGKFIPGLVNYAVDKKIDIKLVVLDSIASLIVPAEAGRNFDEMEMGALPKFLKRAFSRTRPLLKQANCAFIAINQAREVLGYGANASSITYPGGKTWRHLIDFAIKLHPSSGADGKLEDEGGKVGHKIIATVEKNRAAPNIHQGEFWFNFYKGVVRVGEEVGVLAAAYGVVQRPNNISWVYKDQTFKGKEAFFTFLEENESIRTELLDAIKIAKANKIKRTATLSDEGTSQMDEKALFFNKD